MIAEQHRWEKFAQQDAEYFVYTPDVGKAQTDDPYFEHGQMLADRIISEAGTKLRRRGRAIEIGCGTGRVAIPMAKCFDQVTGVDIAPTMLKRLQENCADCLVGNVSGRLADELWDDTPADLVYSVQVFQHIESFDLIDDYLRRVATSLCDGGVGYLHFDTRPVNLIYQARRVLPDFALPGQWRRGIRRTRRAPALLRACLADHGLVVVKELRPDTEEHVLIVQA